jgi:hypothetical protein
MEDMRNGHKIMVGKPGGKKPLGRPRRGWEDGRVWTGFMWLKVQIRGGLL